MFYEGNRPEKGKKFSFKWIGHDRKINTPGGTEPINEFINI